MAQGGGKSIWRAYNRETLPYVPRLVLGYGGFSDSERVARSRRRDNIRRLCYGFTQYINALHQNLTHQRPEYKHKTELYKHSVGRGPIGANYRCKIPAVLFGRICAQPTGLSYNIPRNIYQGAHPPSIGTRKCRSMLLDAHVSAFEAHHVRKLFDPIWRSVAVGTSWWSWKLQMG